MAEEKIICMLLNITSSPLTLFPWCACANMAQLPQYWRKAYDVEAGAATEGSPLKSFDVLPALQTHILC